MSYEWKIGRKSFDLQCLRLIRSNHAHLKPLFHDNIHYFLQKKILKENILETHS